MTYYILGFNIYKTLRQKVLYIANYSYRTVSYSLFFNLPDPWDFS